MSGANEGLAARIIPEGAGDSLDPAVIDQLHDEIDAGNNGNRARVKPEILGDEDLQAIIDSIGPVALRGLIGR